MDPSVQQPSQYLQERLRDRKAETASRHVPRHSTGGQEKRINFGRDDAIFDVDDSPPSKAAPPTFYSSPAGPSSNAVARRRTASSRVSSGAASKAMGARELDDHLDKLSKQNFDLKLEVFHRREKCDELERRVKDVERLEDDNLELREINEDLFAELENRDRAVDEAVVMITDLEAKVKELHEQLADARSSAEQILNLRILPEESAGSHKLAQPRPQKPLLATNISSKIMDVASPAKSEPVRHIPSFIDNNEPNTEALRSLFVHGDKQIRPIPSYTSLLSKYTTREDDDEVIEEPRSPQLSVLSERELGSVYGHDMLDEKVERTAEESLAPISDPSDSSAEYQDRKVERTTHWVASSETSAPKAQIPHQRPKKSEAAPFQSIGGVLHQPVPIIESPTKSPKRQPHSNLLPENKSTPPLGMLPPYGHNAFPPTPDTMNTHSLNRSSSSIIRDKSVIDSSNVPNGSYASLLHGSYLPQLSVSASQANASARNSLLPKEFEAYGDSDDEDLGLTAQMAQEFGVALYQTYSSEDGMSNYETPLTHRHASSMGARSQASPGSRAAFSPASVQASPLRTFGNRRRSFDDQMAPHPLPPPMRTTRGVSESPEHPPASPPRRGSIDMLSRYRVQRLEQDRHSDKAIYPESSPARQREGVMNAQKATSRQPRPLPPAPPSSTPSVAKSPSSSTRSASRPRRVETLRQRLSRFARRGSQPSAPVAPTVTSAHSADDAGTATAKGRNPSALPFGRQSSSLARPATSDTASQHSSPLPRREGAGYMSSTGVMYGTNTTTNFIHSRSSNHGSVDRGRALERPVGGVFSHHDVAGHPGSAHRRVEPLPAIPSWPAGRAEGLSRSFEPSERVRKILSPVGAGPDSLGDNSAWPIAASNDRRPRTAKSRRGSEGTAPLYI